MTMEMELALRVMQVLVAHECELGVDVRIAMAQSWLTEAGLSDEDYKLGLKSAFESEWLTQTGQGLFQITKAGVDAATKTAH